MRKLFPLFSKTISNLYILINHQRINKSGKTKIITTSINLICNRTKANNKLKSTGTNANNYVAIWELAISFAGKRISLTQFTKISDLAHAYI